VYITVHRVHGRKHCTHIQLITADRQTHEQTTLLFTYNTCSCLISISFEQKGATPTLQFVLVLDMQLLADQGVPQAQGTVEQLGAGGEDEGDGGHVGCLGGVQARNCAWLVALALAGREVGGVLGDVEACHDSAGAGVHNQVDHVWLHLWVSASIYMKA